MTTQITAFVEVTYEAEAHMSNDDEAAGAIKNAISAAGFTVGACHVIERIDVEPDDEDEEEIEA